MSFGEKILDPITIKRLRRFKEIRRSYWSLWLLAGLYLLGLFSECLCNDKPILIRFSGAWYFPIFKYYSEHQFTGNGQNTRANYKKLENSENFKENTANFMIFPPIPYGPKETLDPETLDIPKKVTLKLAPIPRLGTVNIRKDFSISRSTSSGYFFGTNNHKVKNLNLNEYWRISPELEQAIALRFSNKHAEKFSLSMYSLANPTLNAKITLSTYTPRSRPPKTIRLSFKENKEFSNEKEIIVFDDKLRIIENRSTTWENIDPKVQESIRQKVKKRFSEPIESEDLIVGDLKYEIFFDKNDIRWPYPPLKKHWLGIDSAGRDVLARIIYGLRISMTFGFVLVLFSMSLGVFMGAIQGYYGGRIDIITQRLIEIWSALPFLYIMILMGSVYGRSFGLLLFIYGIFNWIGISYYIRAEFLKLRKRPFVEAAKCMGIPDYKIIFKHILPNALVPIITFFPFSLVGAIGSLAALDYLGFGLPPPTPSWGELLSQAQEFRWAWWLILYPSLALFLVMLLGVFVGEGVRNAFDPRRYSRIQ